MPSGSSCYLLGVGIRALEDRIQMNESQDTGSLPAVSQTAMVHGESKLPDEWDSDGEVGCRGCEAVLLECIHLHQNQVKSLSMARLTAQRSVAKMSCCIGPPSPLGRSHLFIAGCWARCWRPKTSVWNRPQ